MKFSLPPNDTHNQTLVNNTHPENWINPNPENIYNILVIGGGTAGLVSAAGSAGLGAKVALIENKLLGGDCLNFGCVPSKALIHQSKVEKDFSKAMTRVREIRAQISEHDSAQRFKNLGVDIFLGNPEFDSPNSVILNSQKIKFRKAIIATGSRAAIPPIPGLIENKVDFLTNETVFNLINLPNKIIIIGGGPIGCEMAQAFRRFGSEVTILCPEPMILPKEDADCAEIIKKQFESDGIEITNNIKILDISQNNSQKNIKFTHNNNNKSIFCDALILAAGRRPNIENLNLEMANIKFNNSGVTVNNYLQTSNPNIFAAGDVCSPFQFTHAADAMARICIQNALFFGKKKASDLIIPWGTYTSPEIAHVGLNLNQIKTHKSSQNIKTISISFSEVDRAICESDTKGLARVHYDSKSGKIMGATVVHKHAGDLISEISLAMTNNLTLGHIAKTIHPYPTNAEIWKKIGDAYNRTKLTPTVSKFMKKYLGWRR